MKKCYLERKGFYLTRWCPQFCLACVVWGQCGGGWCLQDMEGGGLPPTHKKSERGTLLKVASRERCVVQLKSTMAVVCLQLDSPLQDPLFRNLVSSVRAEAPLACAVVLGGLPPRQGRVHRVQDPRRRCHPERLQPRNSDAHQVQGLQAALLRPAWSLTSILVIQ